MSDPSRPQLAPGLRVVRRGRSHLQVGLYDGRRTLLPRTEVVERTLEALLEHRLPREDPETATVLAELDRRRCLVWRHHPAAQLAPVAVQGALEIPGVPLVTDLATAAGLRVVGSPAEAEVVVVVGAGETDRDHLDPLVRSGTSHVVVSLVDGGAIIGPFVVPGLTACLRCIDAHRTVRDPDHVAVTTRYVHATSRRRADGMADVVDPALALLAVSWAIRDVVAHLAGTEPSTWSRTFHWEADPVARTEDLWLRHPACGCSWSADLLPVG